jgi:predicted RNA methylase
MSKPKLHLDEDASRNALYEALTKNGHDVTRTPNEWIKKKAKDEEQLQKASEHGRSIFSFNKKHFLQIASKPQKHKGVIVSEQKPLSIILKALNRFFHQSSAEEMENQVRWLSDWEKED